VFQSLQGDIQRAVVDQKYLFGLALNRTRYALPMAGSGHKRLQNQQVQRALQQGNVIIVSLLGSHSTQVFTRLGRMSTQVVFRINSSPSPISPFARLQSLPVPSLRFSALQ
jgi:hypothetical protein